MSTAVYYNATQNCKIIAFYQGFHVRGGFHHYVLQNVNVGLCLRVAVSFCTDLSWEARWFYDARGCSPVFIRPYGSLTGG